VGEGLHFVGPEKEGAAYRLIVVRKREQQRALFPEFEYSYRLYVTNTDWSLHNVVRFYRKRGDAENVIRELKEGYATDHILSEEFLANAVFFQLQLLAYNLVELFKYAHLDRSWWRLRIKQLRYRLLNIAGVVARHARRTDLRLSVHYRYVETFRRIFQLLQIAPVELRLQRPVSVPMFWISQVEVSPDRNFGLSRPRTPPLITPLLVIFVVEKPF
jgi:hypothetical protein